MFNIQQAGSFIIIRTLKIDSVSPSPAVKLDVEIQTQSFSGRHQVWIQISELEHFYEQLVTLEKQRVGSAQIVSMSPDELALIIEVFDLLGHTAVYGNLQKLIYVKNKTYQTGVLFAFEFDPSILPTMVSELIIFKENIKAN